MNNVWQQIVINAQAQRDSATVSGQPVVDLQSTVFAVEEMRRDNEKEEYPSPLI
ncbi:MAG: hypothetical protein WBK55_05595 [Alphaproteobacteria bacterium]